MNSQSNILWISSQDWDDIWTRKQRFARAFARAGYRVFYVNYQLNLASYALGLRKWQAQRALGFARAPREVEPGLFVWNPPLVFPYALKYDLVNHINNQLLLLPLRYHLKRLGFQAPIMWIYPLTAAELIGKLNERLVIYDCVDDWPSFKGPLNKNLLTRYETAILERADITFVTHPALLEKRVSRARDIHLVPNAVDTALFAKAQSPDTQIPEDICDIPQPRIGFVGAFHFCLDYQLLVYLAMSRSNWSFVFVGPVVNVLRPEVASLRALPNVHLLGRREPEALPAYLKAFDVCINPFDVDEPATYAIDPLKLYEYLGAGKPVVSVDMPAAQQMSEYVTIAHSHEEFLVRIEEILAVHQKNTIIAERLRYASLHSWDNRFNTVRQVVEARSHKQRTDNPF